MQVLDTSAWPAQGPLTAAFSAATTCSSFHEMLRRQVTDYCLVYRVTYDRTADATVTVQLFHQFLGAGARVLRDLCSAIQTSYRSGQEEHLVEYNLCCRCLNSAWPTQ